MSTIEDLEKKLHRRIYAAYIFITVLSFFAIYYLTDTGPKNGNYYINMPDDSKYMSEWVELDIRNIHLPNHIRLPQNAERYFYMQYKDAANTLYDEGMSDPYNIIVKDGEHYYSLAAYNGLSSSKKYMSWCPLKREFICRNMASY